MNAIFNVKRFGLLVKSDWQLNWKQNLLGFLAIAAGLFLFMMVSINKPWLVPEYSNRYWYTYNENNWFSYVMLVAAAYLIIVLLVAFREFTNKTTRARYLLLPASRFEKYLYQVVTVFSVGVILYLILWVDAQLVRAYIIHHYNLTEEVVALFEPFRLLTPFNDADSVWEAVTMGLIVVGLAAYAMNANLWFRKFGWLKMIILLILLIYGYMAIMVGFSHLFYPEATQGFNIHTPTVHIPGTEVPVFKAYAFVVVDVVWLMLLVIGFVKFKESEL
jgi:hypothetical protein